MEEALFTHNLHWKQPYENLYPRKLFQAIVQKLHLRQIHVLKGIRRSGKTTLFKLIINHLAKEIDNKAILYVTLMTPTFQNFTATVKTSINYSKLLKRVQESKFNIFF